MRVTLARKLLIGALWVITTTLHLPRHLRPDPTQARTGIFDNHAGATADTEQIVGHWRANFVGDIQQAMLDQDFTHIGDGAIAHLQHCTQLFTEQHRHVVITQRTNIHFHAAMTGKGHLRQRNQQTTIRTVVVGQQMTRRYQLLHRIEEGQQTRWIIQIGRLIAQLLIHLGQRRAANAVTPFA